MRAAIALASLAACGSKVNPEYCAKHPDDHHYCAYLDAAIDTVDAPALCLGSDTFALCVDPPAAPVTLTADLDTDLSPLCLAMQPPTWKAAGQPDACVIAGTTIDVPMVVAHGGRPLVLVAADTITVTGLDVSSRRGATSVGAGYAPGACAAFAGAPGADNNGGGGGAGGSFVTAGGGGGTGDTGFGGAGSAAPVVMSPTLLQGGCPGQDGGASGATGGTGGAGGGAVYVVAGGGIDLTGATIDASGASGVGGGKSAGGGGGGSGGMIVLHASTIGTSGALLVANGAGGGAGGSGGSAGSSGSDPDPATPLTAAPGGTGAGGGGSGGNGFAGSTAAQPGANALTGNAGGGGGGGGGYIQSNHTLATTNASPAPVIK
ncbi:MAG: hypothetical protein ACM31C_09715 [Acidobacteriota bacterium]